MSNDLKTLKGTYDKWVNALNAGTTTTDAFDDVMRKIRVGVEGFGEDFGVFKISDYDSVSRVDTRIDKSPPIKLKLRSLITTEEKDAIVDMVDKLKYSVALTGRLLKISSNNINNIYKKHKLIKKQKLRAKQFDTFSDDEIDKVLEILKNNNVQPTVEDEPAHFTPAAIHEVE